MTEPFNEFQQIPRFSNLTPEKARQTLAKRLEEEVQDETNDQDGIASWIRERFGDLTTLKARLEGDLKDGFPLDEQEELYLLARLDTALDHARRFVAKRFVATDIYEELTLIGKVLQETRK